MVFQVPSKEALKIADALEQLGFNTKLLGTESYVMKRLGMLSLRQLAQLKEAFIKNSHPRLHKEIAVNRHGAFGTKQHYVEGIKNADLSKMAKLINVVGILLQTKVYLFWSRKEA